MSKRIPAVYRIGTRMTEQRTKLILHMLTEKPWDFCYLAYVCCDRLQHQLWEEAIALDPRTNKYYKMLDEALGQIMAMLEGGLPVSWPDDKR